MNVYALDLRASQFGCDRQRLAELTKWLDQSRKAPMAPAIYHGPLVSSPARSAWNSRDAETQGLIKKARVCRSVLAPNPKS